MLAEKEEALARLILNFGANTRKVSKQKRTKGYLVARRNLLADYWKRYNDFRDDISAADVSEVELGKIKVILGEARLATIESAYCEALGEVHDEIEELDNHRSENLTATMLNHTCSGTTSTSTTVLPKILLPKFDGSFEKWLNFKDMFTTCVINEASLSDVQRMHYLKGSLLGEAETMLRSVSVQENNFVIAWDMLQQRYDNKRRLVKSYMRNITKLPTINSESDIAMRKLLDTVTESVRALKQLGRPTEHWDDWLVLLVTEKLDPVTVKEWEMSLESPSVLPEYKTLVQFLEKRIQGIEAVSSTNKHKNREGSSNKTTTTLTSIRSHQTNLGRCVCCSGKHALMYCAEFKKKEPAMRLDLTLKFKLCKNCLKANHSTDECRSSYTCMRCSQKHHTFLHDSLSSQRSSVAALHTCPDHCVEQSTSDAETCLPAVLLATAYIKAQSSTGHYIQLRALLDSGSQASFISEYAVQQLRLRRSRLKIPITGLGGHSVGESKGIVTFALCSPTESNFSVNCSALILPRLGNLLPLKRVDPKPYVDFLGLTLADPNFYNPCSIDVIIGADLYGLLVKGEIKHTSCGAAIAQNTYLGWVIYGRIPSSASPQLCTTHFTATAPDDLSSLVQQLWKFHEFDDILPTSKMTQDELFCEEFFKNTVQRTSSGRYQIRYPFRDDCDLTKLSISKADAIKLFHSQQARLRNDPEMNQLYTAFMTEYLTLGHMEKVVEIEEPKSVCYIPHHGVYKESSTTTKLRTVFNASRKALENISLNDCLHVGPKLQSDLSQIIMRWRVHRVGFMADIEKCYRQILVSREDADMQRIIWRGKEEEPAVYRLLTVTYGLNCSPYLAIKVLQTLAKDEEANYPEASKVLRESFYVDDCLHGADSVEAALEIQYQLRQLLERGGFVLRKWSSNSVDFMQRLNSDDRDKGIYCNLNLDRETKALGIYWLCESDSLTYKVNLSPLTKPITKRQQLSDISKIYDPPGLLAPITVTGKAMCQKLWVAGLNWDDPIPEPLQQEWQKFRMELSEIEHLRIPRWLGIEPNSNCYQLHVFSDASAIAYAAVAYLRIHTAERNVHVSILAAKTKIAPLKKITIPCLELNGALLAAQLVSNLSATLQLPSLQTYCWSDSKTVLSWIRSHPGKYKQYVSNRISKIQALTSVDSWTYVPTATNPADAASRGFMPSQLIKLSIWWNGPPWLQRPSHQWPTQPLIGPTKTETTVISLATMPSDQPSSLLATLLSKYSNLNKLLGVTAFMQRFIAAVMKKPHETTPWCSAGERTQALKLWHRYVQHTHFNNELSCLRMNNPISKKSKLLQFNPIIDEDGIIRLNGRLQSARFLSTCERSPIILPKEGELSKLLIVHAHESTLHGGTQATLNFLRQRYWIIRARSAVKQCIHRCVKCFRQNPTTLTQLMGNLPSHRCNPAKPFDYCGIDYGGPYSIRTTKGRGYRSYKGYIALFVCFVTRAVHLELVSDLSTDAFLAALRRFFSQRGYCSHIYSDCATTFVGANAELKADFAACNQQLKAAARFVAVRGISWHFIPPGSPNFGGIWEAGIKGAKHHLKRVIGRATLTFEEFFTVLKQVEAALNSRPLSALTDDPSDLTALTPGHFLVGGPLIAIPEPNLLEISTNRLKRWKLLQQIQQDIWKRWSSEYLPHLQVRYKWKQTHQNLKIGDLVLLRDERAPPLQWPLGRVMDIHPGSDGIVRVVTIRTATSTLKRAISKLVALPIDADIDSHGGWLSLEHFVAQDGRGGRNVKE